MATINCKPVNNFRFSAQGAATLKDIQRKLDNGKIISGLMMVETFHLIFTNTSATWHVGLNITSADWEGLAKAAGDWPNTLRSMIARQAAKTAILTSGQESVFWEELNV